MLFVIHISIEEKNDTRKTHKNANVCLQNSRLEKKLYNEIEAGKMVVNDHMNENTESEGENLTISRLQLQKNTNTNWLFIDHIW